MKNFLWLAIMLFLLFLSSCTCGSSYKNEPLMEMEFNSYKDSVQFPLFTNIVAENASKPLKLENASFKNQPLIRAKLPIDMNADSTRYFFYSANRIDTLSIRYKRIFDYDKHCGYTLRLEQTNKETIRSTFKLKIYLDEGEGGGIMPYRINWKLIFSK